MTRAVVAVLALVMVAACAASSEPKSSPSGRCLYAVEGIEFGRMLKWAPCDNPPPYAISRISN
jgi:hypothetical protein